MKLWKSTTFAFVLCGAALSVLLLRHTGTVGPFKAKTRRSHATSEPPAAAATSSAPRLTLHRRTRSADDMSSLLSEFSMMFQSFTEGELQRVLETLLDRRRRRSRRLEENPGRRTKRARRPKPCSLRELELTVSELGLGYDSDETVMLRYCSGKCAAQRHNYDIAMQHMARAGFRKRGRKDKVSNGPCCRPTAFEKDFSFLDNRSRYHTIHNVSAKHCGCV
ncbi:neurturin [Betta splendens]|uniref:Neurturin n=1 Tax=Betta splendens TaxID=158456 RepID=A0A6P7L2L4_BETSP|nr:neurturin [Betta splendens]XP_028988824.1 neurturin [Betta splendens]XP_055359971.1 neurturin [Betta splendens]